MVTRMCAVTNLNVCSDEGSDQEPDSKKGKKTPKDAVVMDRNDLVRAMGMEHPLITMDVGTLSSNSGQALCQDTVVSKEVQRVLKDAVSKASSTKKACQLLVGQYVEHVTASGTASGVDRLILDALCPRISTKDSTGNKPSGKANASGKATTSGKGTDKSKGNVTFCERVGISNLWGLGSDRSFRCYSARWPYAVFRSAPWIHLFGYVPYLREASYICPRLSRTLQSAGHQV